jgi:hypothetical protein
MGVFIGLDVSLNKTAVCVVDREGAVLLQGKVPIEPEPSMSEKHGRGPPSAMAGTADRLGVHVPCCLSAESDHSPSIAISRRKPLDSVQPPHFLPKLNS